MSAKIHLPDQPRFLERLPIYYKVDRAARLAGWEVEIVRSAARYFDKLAPELGLKRLFVEDVLAPVLTITRTPYPRDPESWGYLVRPEPENWPCTWATIELYPKWFNSAWSARKGNLIRHEFAHLLGFSHSDSWYSVMHPKLCTGWWPWGLPLLPGEKRELVRHWRPIVDAGEQPQ